MSQSLLERPAGPTTNPAERLNCLLDVARVVNSSLEVDVVIDRILDHATSILQAESGSVMLVDESTRKLQVLAARGPRAKEIVGKTQELGEGIAGWVALHGEPVLLHGAMDGERFRPLCTRSDVRDALSVPLRTENQVLGVVNLSNRRSETPFSEDDLALLTALGDHTAVAVRNARSYRQMQRQHQTLERLLDEVNNAQQEERLRIALYLQESAGKSISSALDRVRAARSAPPSQPVEGVLADVENSLHQAIQETRLVMLDLHPPRLQEATLHGVLQQYAQEFEQHTGIRTHYVKAGGEGRLPASLTACFYRVVQEALANVWKQTQANQVWLTCDVGRSACMLEVRDDYRLPSATGSSSLAPRRRSFLSLQERVNLMGGRLTVKAAGDEGTTVRIMAPLAS